MIPTQKAIVPFMNQDRAVVASILGLTDAWTIGSFSLVCKDWNELLKEKCYSVYGSVYVWQAAAYSQFPSSGSRKIPHDFPLYLRIDSNFERAFYSLKNLPNARNPIVVTGEDLFSTSWGPDGETRIMKWDWKTGKQTATLWGHEANITSMSPSKHGDGEYLFSRDLNGTVRKWDAKEGSCLKVCSVPAHQKLGAYSKVLVLAAGSQFLTNAIKGTIDVWDIESCDHLYTIPHTDPLEAKDTAQSFVYSWTVDDNEELLFAGYTDGRIRIWDLKVPKSCIATREPDFGHKGEEDRYDASRRAVASMIVKGSELFFGDSHLQLLRSWNWKSNVSRVVFGRHGNWGRPMAINEVMGRIFSGFNLGFNYIRICKTDDLKETLGEESLLIKIHKSCMRELFEKYGIVFSSADRSVRILDFTKSWKEILEEIASEIAAQDVFMANEEDSDGSADNEDVQSTFVQTLRHKNQQITITQRGDPAIEKYGLPWVERGEGPRGSDGHDEDLPYSEDSEASEVDSAIERFSRLPQAIQQAVFEKLDAILRRDASDYNANPEEAFYEENGQSATPAQKAEAIRAFLQDAS